jgi:hypothetical protein
MDSQDRKQYAANLTQNPAALESNTRTPSLSTTPSRADPIPEGAQAQHYGFGAEQPYSSFAY